jgi:hypothetical protein
MRSSTARKSGLALAAGSVVAAVGIPLAIAAPTAVPPSDAQGYLDSTARCAAPDTAVVFGTTATSRVAICKTADGAFQYRGVRVSDGARLIVAATETSGDSFIARNAGTTYTVTPTALSVTINGDTLRTESWTDYHGSESPATSTATPDSSSGTDTSATSAASTPSASPSTSATATSAAPTTGAAATSAPRTSATPSTTVPPPPPLQAEVGGGTSADG